MSDLILPQRRAFRPCAWTGKQLNSSEESNQPPTKTMTTLFIVCLAVWLAKGAAQICAGSLQVLAGFLAGLCGALLWCLALPVQALEILWRTAFPKY